MGKFFVIFFVVCTIILEAQSTGVQVETQFAGVRVYINGSLKGETNADSVTGLFFLRIILAPGRYTLRCEYRNHVPVETTVNIPGGGGFVRQSMKLLLQVGTIEIRSIPSGASVELDGKTTKSLTDCKIQGVPVGTHRVKVIFPKASLSTEMKLDANNVMQSLPTFTPRRFHAILCRSGPIPRVVQITLLPRFATRYLSWVEHSGWVTPTLPRAISIQ